MVTGGCLLGSYCKKSPVQAPRWGNEWSWTERILKYTTNIRWKLSNHRFSGIVLCWFKRKFQSTKLFICSFMISAAEIDLFLGEDEIRYGENILTDFTATSIYIYIALVFFDWWEQQAIYIMHAGCSSAFLWSNLRASSSHVNIYMVFLCQSNQNVVSYFTINTSPQTHDTY